MKYAHSKDEVPFGKHFAIIIFSSVWIPGDERSRTAPGHGYPEHSEHKADYLIFASEEEWKNWIENEMSKSFGHRADFLAIRAERAVISQHTNII